MKVLLAGGGSAGHINPALSIAKVIKEKIKDADIRFVGTEYGLEDKLVPKEGFQLYHIDVRGFKRQLTLENFKILFKAAGAISQSKKIIKEFKPDVVIGTGGYVSGPVLYAAAKSKIPTLIHEQNAFPGLTSKILSRFVDKIMISFEESRDYFKIKDKEKFIFTGNPVRPDFIGVNKEIAKEKLSLSDKKAVLSFGGSQGARCINNVMSDIFIDYKDEKDITFIHGYGKFGASTIPEKLKNAGINEKDNENIRVSEYIYNMEEVMAAADLIICRSGAITMTELGMLSKAAILIPSPVVANDHQTYNARAFEKKGGAVVILEKEVTAISLYKTIKDLINDEEGLLKMGENAKKCINVNANNDIYDVIMKTMKK
ncbi:MAG: undecaprenyldiphospho-muramoylpentapeptide beta-N-acetylglucosaminyltransferase [Clostridia bacterium]|nr:undecaprenyldiphospho-muramoylpentapeptide beta-N-acetylglucosaminyltransferase [Clostridia bacterium]